MQLQVSDLVDKATILMVKDDHGLPVREELDAYVKELKSLKQTLHIKKILSRIFRKHIPKENQI